MSSTPSIVPDVSAMPALPAARPPTSTSGQQTDSQPFADFLDTQDKQPASAASVAASPNSPANNRDANGPVMTKSDTASSGASSSGTAPGRGTVASGTGTAKAKGSEANTSTAAGRKLKIAIGRAAVAMAAHARSQPVADPSVPAPDAGSGASQAVNSDDSSTQQDSSAAADSDLQSLVSEVVDALNRIAADGGAPVRGNKAVPVQSGKPTDESEKDDGSTDPTAATSANTGAGQAQTAANQQQTVTAQPAVANATQPVAAALVVNTAVDSSAPANAPDANSRGKVVIMSGGVANSPAQGAKDAAVPGTPLATPATGLTPQTNSAKTENSSPSSGQAAAAQTSSGASSSDPANPTPTDGSSANNNTAPQPQGQSQPAGAPAAVFTIATAGPQGGIRAGQVSNDIATTASAEGAAANGTATSSVLANLGAQAANAPPPAATMPLASAVAIPIAGLAVEIAARARAGSNKFDIRLDPPELGRIDVRLDVDRNGQVTSHVTVDRPDTLQLLQSQQPQLQRALEQAGLTTTNNGLQFTLRDQSFAGQNGGGGNGSQPPVPQLIIPDAKLAAIDTAQIYSRWNFVGGLDIRV